MFFRLFLSFSILFLTTSAIEVCVYRDSHCHQSNFAEPCTEGCHKDPGGRGVFLRFELDEDDSSLKESVYTDAECKQLKETVAVSLADGSGFEAETCTKVSNGAELWGGTTDLYFTYELCQAPTSQPREKACSYVLDECGDHEAATWLSLYYCTLEGPRMLSYADARELVLCLCFWGLLGFLIFYLLQCVASTADVILAPALGNIAELLKISPAVTGATFLALGSGAPDVFSGIAAAKNEDTVFIGVGNFVGGTAFITLVVAAVVVLTVINSEKGRQSRNVGAMEEGLTLHGGQSESVLNSTGGVPVQVGIFTRDLTFLWLAVILMLIFAWDESVSLFEALCFPALYCIYVGVVVVQEALELRRKKRERVLNGGLGEEEDEELEETPVMSPQRGERGRGSAMGGAPLDPVIEDADAEQAGGLSGLSAKFKSTNNEVTPHPSFHSIVTEGREPDRRRSTLAEAEAEGKTKSNGADEQTLLSSASSPGSNGKTETSQDGSSEEQQQQEREGGVLSPSSVQFQGRQSIERQGSRRQFLWLHSATQSFQNIHSRVKRANQRVWAAAALRERIKRRVEKMEWDQMSLSENILFVLLSPFILLRWFTTPTEKWDRVQFACLPLGMCLFLLYNFMDDGLSLDREVFKVPFIPSLVVIGLVLAVVLRFSALEGMEEEAPRWITGPLIFVSFFMALLWINLISDALMGCLAAMCLLANIPKMAVGLTLLAWGNSIPDMVSNIALSRKGKLYEMALTACFAGPLFNVLIGFGCAMARASFATGKMDFPVFHRGNWSTSSILLTLLFSVPFTYLAVALSRFAFKRWTAACLSILYMGALGLSLFFAFTGNRTETGNSRL
uniref:Sodium/calcium exchanger membrane region domain-containing protein n=1 Tax=Chromera velia CCMP2878 TaxID=1169474 RepID=A0A0G4GIM6_9ALVE|eukprot:Cvel_4766.t1-p1 / transcript=Cvel_4766.t1 / gene=Cvel_4766 / organism=Chromera_velia_CCMP2878 / gene_product=Cation/calcium exchanger 5, putative / transcript_product=Cation/calcium exchanger 5, putative / location=Cvel_scaffold212:83920-88333(-) / protein_length=847 / sequence_SO=supercontig / SO=protein_coding / is_pseudo=false